LNLFVRPRDLCPDRHAWLRRRRRPCHGRFIGQVNNTTFTVAAMKKGDTIAFGRHDIVDWMHMDAGAMKGNFSARAILKAALPRDRAPFRRRFGLDFDF
jgi:uncharacterized protein YegJ (DUF2314 family)